ncbi:MAG: tripartite tricarboxylate transporter TctB family protein [Burkholderiaceae bacterium]|jgi:putative tricarboxylic transport membrane protein|nr:tripartite tricarboxylate transporter TctB family protein [Oxalobacteraceae bacterium]
MKLHDTLSGLALLILALIIAINSAGFPEIPGQQIGPAVFPRALAALLALCAVLLIFRARLPAPGQAWVQLGAWLQSPVHRRNFVITLACLVFYIVASELLGFLLCSVLILCVMFHALSVKPSHIVPIALGVTLLIHTLFYKGLRVPLPWGVLSPIQW